MPKDLLRYPTYNQARFADWEKETLEHWTKNKVFEQTLKARKGAPEFTFYEGPPSANGIPGIHHVMARAIKDLFCRYKTLKGFRVERKGGWDTHGLPIELSVEKTLGITKEDIGKKISVEEYNKACRKEVMKYKELWDRLTLQMGYWVDLDNPYITFDTFYMETLWYLLKELYNKDLLYKDYTIQPYSPAAGTGLSSHELNQPGCYKPVKDISCVAQFRVLEQGNFQKNFGSKLNSSPIKGPLYFLAWTTTPWTLPSNTALGVGPKINYVLVATYNPYTGVPMHALLARDRLGAYFPEEGKEAVMQDYQPGQKILPWRVLGEFKGTELQGLRYEQLLPYAQPTDGDAFQVLSADFVTTEDGTGIVHLAPSFGADDFRTARSHGIGSLTLVDKQGRFTSEMGEFAGMYVKNYNNADESDPEYKSTDLLLCLKLKAENKAFKIEKYEHNYPHCWRTDKPILYYPLESWFIKTTAVKDRMVELNRTINWKPESTGTGRFGHWLENLVDWNLSRSRFWGTPLPIWRTADGSEERCIGSLTELKEEIQRAVKAGVLKKDPYEGLPNHEIDLHRPYVDHVVLVSDSGQAMYREPDLIDVWFDSGAMPYAQWHYPFENKETFVSNFPADFIAEGVDQTRGWFFTLHAIACMINDSVAFKNVVSNGLVLDKDGNKMSKRLGNAVDPFKTIDEYGADATRWYMIGNAAPWDNLKFNVEGIQEVRRKFFGTLYNTYSFFALYANIDRYQPSRDFQPLTELDQWIISRLQGLISEAGKAYEAYEPTRAVRAIQDFVTEDLSNWYVRLSRRRFWKGETGPDKQSAFDTLFRCLEQVCVLMSPVAPFYSYKLYQDLKGQDANVHAADFPAYMGSLRQESLEQMMDEARDITSLALSLRKKTQIKVRQPLKRLLIPVSGKEQEQRIRHMEALIKAEINVKELEYLRDRDGVLVKTIKADFKKLGPVLGKHMKAVAQAIAALPQESIRDLETKGSLKVSTTEGSHEIQLDQVELGYKDIPGWEVAGNGRMTVALDMEITPELESEGLARELVNRIQNLRKEREFLVTDRIKVLITGSEKVKMACQKNKDYICTEILATLIDWKDEDLPSEPMEAWDLEGEAVKIAIYKSN